MLLLLLLLLLLLEAIGPGLKVALLVFQCNKHLPFFFLQIRGHLSLPLSKRGPLGSKGFFPRRQMGLFCLVVLTAEGQCILHVKVEKNRSGRREGRLQGRE